MTFRMIALDVDGTLIDDHFNIQPKTKEILKKVYEEGVVITLCTGRNPESTIPVMETLGMEGPIVAHNGALCLHSKTRKIYGEIGFKIHELNDLIRYCRAKNLHFDVNTAFDLYVETMSPEIEHLYLAYYTKPNRVADVMGIEEEILKLTILGEYERIGKSLIELRDDFPQFQIMRSGENYIDIMHPRVTKGYGLAIVCNQLGISLDEVLAMGNYYNDIEMLEEVGFGIAMENSPEDVKKVAKAITKSNNEEGVYHAIIKYLYDGNLYNEKREGNETKV